MRFGFFDQLPCADADSERQRYQDLMAQIELGDALGFDTCSALPVEIDQVLASQGGQP